MVKSIVTKVDYNSKVNNFLHHTSEISVKDLIVRRGQPFDFTLTLNQRFDKLTEQIVMTVMTGSKPSEGKRTFASFSLPDPKAAWKAEIKEDDTDKTGRLTVSITPAADCPIGEYILMGKHKEEEMLLGLLVVLFNPWCPDDVVFMKNKKARHEYVMNQDGIIFRGSHDYIHPLDWDFGQFEENMVNICLKLLDLNPKHEENAEDDVSSRSDPIYVGRVVSAMINCNGDQGVVAGQWGGPYEHGERPGHWSGSYKILKKWFKGNFQPVRYGQCWVFGGVMCSVMRLLGIPTRVVTNFASAHDTNKSLTIDTYHSKEGVPEKPSHDSIWNYHVWVESWMKRADLSPKGTYDGWQVLDPTPQERSEGVFCCGPASVQSILKGETTFSYDVPFVFAEVNADVVDWLVSADGSTTKLYSDSKRVGKKVSTKGVQKKKRRDLTNKYKPAEGSKLERVIFKYAITKDYSEGLDEDSEDENEDDGEDEDMEEGGEEPTPTEDSDSEDTVDVEETEDEDEGDEEVDEEEEIDVDEEDDVQPSPLPVIVRFIEVTAPTNGKDVRLKLMLICKSTTVRQLSVNIKVKAMNYNGTSAANIQTEDKDVTLNPKKGLTIPIRVKYLDYHPHMLECDSLRVEVLVTDKEHPENTYVAEDDVVLLDPTLTVKMISDVKMYRRAKGEVVFLNPVSETLTNCSLTLSASGIWKDECTLKIPDLKKNHRIRVQFIFVPYRLGEKTLVADFDCSAFRDIKGHCTIVVKP